LNSDLSEAGTIGRERRAVGELVVEPAPRKQTASITIPLHTAKFRLELAGSEQPPAGDVLIHSFSDELPTGIMPLALPDRVAVKGREALGSGLVPGEYFAAFIAPKGSFWRGFSEPFLVGGDTPAVTIPIADWSTAAVAGKWRVFDKDSKWTDLEFPLPTGLSGPIEILFEDGTPLMSGLAISDVSLVVDNRERMKTSHIGRTHPVPYRAVYALEAPAGETATIRCRVRPIGSGATSGTVYVRAR
jgi:hypothetical protein